MRNIITLILLCYWPAAFAEGSKATIDFTLPSTQGNNLRLAEQRGQVVVLYLWASWCGSCVQSMAEMGKLASQTRKASELTWWMISADSDPDIVARHTTQLSADIPVLIDLKGQLGEQLNIDNLPTTLIIDRDGVIAHRLTGDNAIDMDVIQSNLTAVMQP